MTVAVTGASGELGSAVATQLLEKLDPAEIVLVTRRPEALAAFAERGVTVRRGDFDERESLAGAFEGVDRVLVISTTHVSTPHRVEQHLGAFAAAKASGVRHVAFTSMPKVDELHPTGVYAMEYFHSEALLKMSGLAWTILQNAPYAEFLVPRFALALSKGRLLSNAGEGRIAPVTHEDCAAAAVAVLVDEGHENKTYVITGPELFTQAELAALVSEVTGQELPVVEIDDDEMRRQGALDGIPEPMPLYLSRHLKAVKLRYFDDLTTTFEDLVGRSPRPLREVLVEHRDELLG